ncbi:PadR family transcriptional regulator [Nocardioides sp. NPDC126508]
MALKNAILAALLDKEASGYDLAKAFDSSVANFWTATPQQLYRELDKLAGDGLIEARVVEQERRPNKKMFRLTGEGAEALAAFTATAAKPTAVRDELLVKVQAVDSGDLPAVSAAIAARRESAQAKLEQYEKLQKRMLGGQREDDYLAKSPRVGPYLTLLRGIAFERENIAWAERCLSVLAQRTS